MVLVVAMMMVIVIFGRDLVAAIWSDQAHVSHDHLMI